MSKVTDQVRSLTGYTDDVIDKADMGTLEEVAMREVQNDVGRDLDFTSRKEEAALFSLLCVYTKIHTGELASGSFSVGEMESASMTNDQASRWFKDYKSKRSMLLGSGGTGHVKGQRGNRMYGGDNS